MSKLAKEFRGQSKVELLTKIKDCEHELFNLRFQQAANQLENNQRIPEVRKQIAVIKTILGEQELAHQ